MKLYKTIILLVILLSTLMSVGCSKTEAEVAEGVLRHGLFVECMEIASKMPIQAEDNVSDVISACSNEAWNIARHMSK